ncbi:hypothetical protein [Rhizobium mesosinicum]|uniref:Uncharacterized protein n=1 Tax=Rhizobium mesosinicum TaxID=335017 RepID=A0ABS7GRV7_9HYPH|nr:hypothetical protein [Rhizobium mesosinicum]MBW9052422.1 hypothetical protein [Rhizobium mesosinicum]
MCGQNEFICLLSGIFLVRRNWYAGRFGDRKRQDVGVLVTLFDRGDLRHFAMRRRSAVSSLAIDAAIVPIVELLHARRLNRLLLTSDPWLLLDIRNRRHCAPMFLSLEGGCAKGGGKKDRRCEGPDGK